VGLPIFNPGGVVGVISVGGVVIEFVGGICFGRVSPVRKTEKRGFKFRFIDLLRDLLRKLSGDLSGDLAGEGLLF
jgi:hypothetical protein